MAGLQKWMSGSLLSRAECLSEKTHNFGEGDPNDHHESANSWGWPLAARAKKKKTRAVLKSPPFAPEEKKRVAPQQPRVEEEEVEKEKENEFLFSTSGGVERGCIPPRDEEEKECLLSHAEEEFVKDCESPGGGDESGDQRYPENSVGAEEDENLTYADSKPFNWIEYHLDTQRVAEHWIDTTEPESMNTKNTHKLDEMDTVMYNPEQNDDDKQPPVDSLFAANPTRCIYMSRRLLSKVAPKIDKLFTGQKNENPFSGIVCTKDRRWSETGAFCKGSMWAILEGKTRCLLNEDKQKRMLTPIYEVHTKKKIKVSDEPIGMKFFNEGMCLLDSFDLTRSNDQCKFHDAIMLTLAQHILKDDYACMREKLLLRFNRTTQNMGALILCPRRWGKSTSVAMALAVCLRICRGINIVIFSTGTDSTTTLLQMTRDFYLQLPDAEQRITINRKDMICTLPADLDCSQGSNSQMRRKQFLCNSVIARSGNVTGNRGITADCFVLEEAAYIPRGILTQIIAPMLKVSNSVLVALSTHQGEENYYSRLFNDQSPEMDKLFIRLRIELICDECKLLGKAPGECKHRAHLNPNWLLTSNENRVKKLMGDDEETYAREVLGAFWSGKKNTFQQSWIDILQNKPPEILDADMTKTSFLFTMIDPAGGGSSRTAISTILVDKSDNSIYIIGMDEVSVLCGPDQQKFMNDYFLHFCQDPILFHMTHYIAVERNYGGSLVAASFLDCAIGILPNIKEYPTPKPFDENLENTTRIRGVWTSNDVNRGGTTDLMWALYEERIFYSSFLVVAKNIALGGDDECIEKLSRASVTTHDDVSREYTEYCGLIKKQLHKQLVQFQKKSKPSGAYTFTGKDNSGARDDIGMCVLLSFFHIKNLNPL
jgi:hypothetical protein